MSSDQFSKIEEYFQIVASLVYTNQNSGNSSVVHEMISLASDMVDFYRRYWKLDMDWAYEELLNNLNKPSDILTASANDMLGRGYPEAAFYLAKTSASLDESHRYQLILAECQRRSGRVDASRAVCSRILQEQPGSHAAMSESFMCDVSDKFWSKDYYDIFSSIHRNRQPRVYLEIGVATGKSLALARTGTRALGVDPALAEQKGPLYHSPENTPQLYGITSDDFFATLDVAKEMGQPNFNVAFIDGLHHFDQVLRDFINLEKFAGPDSVILVHDCLPINVQVAKRERTTAFWTGDVWKIIPCLKTVRPDLEIVTFPAPPAGLAMVRRLDPSSKVLSRQYINIVEQFETLELPESWEERCRLLAVENDESAFDVERFFPLGGWP